VTVKKFNYFRINIVVLQRAEPRLMPFWVDILSNKPSSHVCTGPIRKLRPLKIILATPIEVAAP
jgi:hypothetical protein